MLKDLLKINGIKEVSKKEQVMIYGGARYSCSCTGSVGAWEGSYSSPERALGAIDEWCASGYGRCDLMTDAGVSGPEN